MRWVLPDAPHTIDIDKSPMAQQSIETELTISAEGIIVGCRVIAQKPAPASPAQGACKNQQPGTDTHTIFTKDGEPVSVIVHNMIATSVKPLAAKP